MTTERQRARSLERIRRLGTSGLDSESLRFAAIAELKGVVGFDRWCWPLADPDTLLPPDAIADHDYGPGLPRSLQLEYSDDRYAAKHLLARAEWPATSLAAATEGDLRRSQRWEEILGPVGIGDVAIAACRDRLGTWGWIEVYRDRGDRHFTDDDVHLLRQAAAIVAPALRLRAMRPAAAEPRMLPPGVVVLDSDLRPVSWTAGATAWFGAMPAAELYAAMGILPAVIYAAAAIARTRPHDAARSVAQTVSGEWMSLDVAVLEGRGDDGLAVTVRAATSGETFSILCRAYGLTTRERQLAELVVDGHDTREVSLLMGISRHTVQDHLKSMFDKVGVHSRRQLLSLLARPMDDAGGRYAD